MRLIDPLDDMLSTPAKVAILRVVTGVGAPLAGREIARRAHVWPSAASKALAELTSSGVLVCSHYGRANTYRLDDSNIPLVSSLRGLFQAEADRYRSFTGEMADQLPDAVTVALFGSEARGDARPTSDTDVLIVVPTKTETLERRILELCMGLSERHGLALSWHIADVDEVRAWAASDDPFWRNVRREGIVLYGCPLEGLQDRWQDATTT